VKSVLFHLSFPPRKKVCENERSIELDEFILYHDKIGNFLGIFCLLLFVLALNDECWDEAIFKGKKNWGFLFEFSSLLRFVVCWSLGESVWFSVL
jgi:hypothetical protein